MSTDTIEDALDVPNGTDRENANQDDYNPDRFTPRFKAVIKCVHVGLEEGPDGEPQTVVRFKHAKYEEELKLSMRLKADGDYLSRKFEVGRVYEAIVREAPTSPDGRTQNLRLDGELLSVIFGCVQLGRALPTKKEGDMLAVLSFRFFDLEEGQGNTLFGGSITSTVPGIYVADRFELGNLYRVAIGPAPEWVKQAESGKKGSDFKDTPLGTAIAEHEAGEPDDEMAVDLNEDMTAGTITNKRTGETRDLTPEELSNLSKNLGNIAPGHYQIAAEEETALDTIALESGKLIGFVTDEEIREKAARAAVRVEENGDGSKTYLIPHYGTDFKGQHKPPAPQQDPKAAPAEAESADAPEDSEKAAVDALFAPKRKKAPKKGEA